jgi:hypothetical protein
MLPLELAAAAVHVTQPTVEPTEFQQTHHRVQLEVQMAHSLALMVAVRVQVVVELSEVLPADWVGMEASTSVKAVTLEPTRLGLVRLQQQQTLQPRLQGQLL